jgi:group I intron endonuclease
MKKYGIIYKVTNKVDGKVYIGQTTNSFQKRKHAHCSSLKYNPSKLKSAIHEFGKHNFKFEEILTCFSKSDLDTMEQFYIEKYNSIKNGYNKKEGGSAGKHSHETIEKIRKIKQGNKCNLGNKYGRSTLIKMSKAFGKGLPIIATNLKTGRRTFYLTISETRHYGFDFRKVSRCLNHKAKDGSLFYHKHHTFEFFTYADQNGSDRFKNLSHVQRLGLEPRYKDIKLATKKVKSVSRGTGEEKLHNSPQKAADYLNCGLKSVRAVLEGRRPAVYDHTLSYLE